MNSGNVNLPKRCVGSPPFCRTAHGTVAFAAACGRLRARSGHKRRGHRSAVDQSAALLPARPGAPERAWHPPGRSCDRLSVPVMDSPGGVPVSPPSSDILSGGSGSGWSSPAATPRSRWRHEWRSPCVCSAASPSRRSPASSSCRRPRWRSGSPERRRRSRRRTSPIGCRRPRTCASGWPVCSPWSSSSSTRATCPARGTTRYRTPMLALIAGGGCDGCSQCQRLGRNGA